VAIVAAAVVAAVVVAEAATVAADADATNNPAGLSGDSANAGSFAFGAANKSKTFAPRSHGVTEKNKK